MTWVGCSSAVFYLGIGHYNFLQHQCKRVFCKDFSYLQKQWEKNCTELKQQATQCILSIPVRSDAIIREVPAQIFQSAWGHLGSKPKLEAPKMKSTSSLGRSPHTVCWITAYRTLLSSIKAAVSNHKYWGESWFPRRIQGRKQRVQIIYVLLGTQKGRKLYASLLLLLSLLYRPLFLFQDEYPFFQNNLCLWCLYRKILMVETESCKWKPITSLSS